MQRIGKNSVFQAAGASVCALLLTLVLYLGGSGLGNLLLRLQKSYRTDLFNRAIAGQDAVVRMVEREELHLVATQYLEALMDAVIRFEFFPQQEEAEAFLAVISALPAKVEIEQFQFTGHNLTIFCSSFSEPALAQFREGLYTAACFKDVSLEFFQKKDGSYAGTLICIAA